MDDIIPTLDTTKCLKTYQRTDKSNNNKPIEASRSILRQPPVVKCEENKDLTTKEAVAFLLEGTLKCRVCRYCLKIVPHLSPLEQIIDVAGKGAMYKVAIKDMVASFHPFKVAEDPDFPDRICETCLDRAIAAYLFTQQCEQAERALRNCFEDMYDKLEKLDPIEKTKKRGRQKLSPNHNILYTEHEIVINYAEPIIHIVNTASEVLTVQSPISDLECLKCCEIFPNIDSLVNHSTTHPKSMWYNCRLCGSSFPKKYQLKKHFSCKHGLQSQKPIENPRYECKRCTTVFDKYYEYLQHIEKHKFKMVMEHLIENKMDKLCSLCFSKGNTMLDLNETVCLHGGAPELTGERSLYKVVSATLHEKYNKYQELFIPSQASIIKYIKKKKQGMFQFTLSFPTVIAIENFNSLDVYFFTFSEPLSLNPFSIAENIQKAVSNDKTNADKTPSNIVVGKIQNHEEANNLSIQEDSAFLIEEIDANNDLNPDVIIDDNFKAQITVLESQTCEITEEKFNFLFSHPDMVNLDNNPKSFKSVSNIKTVIETDILNTPKACKENWIFDNCMTQNDIDDKAIFTMSSVNTKNNIGPEALPCKICWVFKQLDKCEGCGKANSSLHTIEFQDKQNESVSSDVIVKTDESPTAKVQMKDLTWQCNICLTINKKGKEKCDCCDAKPLFSNERVNFSFSMKKTDFNYNIDTDNEDQNRKEKKVKVPDVTDKVLSNNEELHTLLQDKAMTYNTDIQFKITEDTKPLLFADSIINNNTIILDKVSPMDTEMAETENLNFCQSNSQCQNLPNFNNEAMDVQISETVDTDFSTSNINTQQITKIDTPNTELNINMTDFLATNIRSDNNVFVTTSRFQFNLGWNDKTRKNRKKFNKSH